MKTNNDKKCHRTLMYAEECQKSIEELQRLEMLWNAKEGVVHNANIIDNSEKFFVSYQISKMI